MYVMILTIEFPNEHRPQNSTRPIILTTSQHEYANKARPSARIALHLMTCKVLGETGMWKDCVFFRGPEGSHRQTKFNILPRTKQRNVICVCHVYISLFLVSLMEPVWLKGQGCAVIGRATSRGNRSLLWLVSVCVKSGRSGGHVRKSI